MVEKFLPQIQIVDVPLFEESGSESFGLFLPVSKTWEKISAERDDESDVIQLPHQPLDCFCLHITCFENFVDVA